ncbi:MAG TPA: PAS domain S-box protein, partial [Chitinophagaceae bacterium]|nr:PAS domain S-box protein [Chitinophagaceae bacterium]
SIVESQEAANEELQSANEEIVSSNEELQSINEELETSKEEIESSNEELITINQELQLRNEQLAEAQEYSIAVVTFMRNSLLILDRDLRVKTANHAFYRTFKVQEENIEGRFIYDLGNRKWDIPEFREKLQRLLHNDFEFTDFEVTNSFPEVGEKTLLLNARKITQRMQDHYLVLIAIEDITEQRKKEKIVVEQEALFRNMADNAPVMLWVTGPDKLCSFVNKTFLEFKGITLEQAIGNDWLDGALDGDKERCERVYRQSFAQKIPFELTYHLMDKDGESKLVLTKAKPNITTEGTFTGFIGSCIEINETVKEELKSEL